MTPELTIVLITILGNIAISSGLWSYLQRRGERGSATTKLLLGLAHERILILGMEYIERGSITKDEYEDFMKYLYEPYSSFGGNGLAEKVMKEVAGLPFVSNTANIPNAKDQNVKHYPLDRVNKHTVAHEERHV